MKYSRNCLISLMLFIICLPVHGIITGELIMLRSEKPFPEAMEALLEAIKSQGFTISRIQRVDTALTMNGYKTDKYRIIFYGRKEELVSLTKKYPEMIPYLPLKFVIYAEADDTLLITSDPSVLIDLYPDPGLRHVFRQWHQDVVRIMKQVRD